MRHSMASIETVIRKGLPDISSRLANLRLTSEGLIAAGAAGIAGRSLAGAMHGKTTAGTYTFHESLGGLRMEHVGVDGWEHYYDGGVEGIVNPDINVIVLVKTADRCCSDFQAPKARRVGSNSEKICKGASLFEHVGTDLPMVVSMREHKSPNRRTARFAVYYLLIDPEGRLELSMPVFEDRRMKSFVERIYLVQDGDLDPLGELPEDAPQDDDFVIEVKRKNEK